MARSRFPSFNGITQELFALCRGNGLSVVTIEKINSTPNVLAALNSLPTSDISPADNALAARDALVEFIEGCGALTKDHALALKVILNLDPEAAWYHLKLGQRRSDLERVLRVGRGKRQTLERGGVLTLAEQMLNSSRRRVTE